MRGRPQRLGDQPEKRKAERSHPLPHIGAAGEGLSGSGARRETRLIPAGKRRSKSRTSLEEGRRRNSTGRGRDRIVAGGSVESEPRLIR